MVTPSLIIIKPPRPKEFPKSSAYAEDSDDEESTVGKMPPSDSEDE
jgi:probable RNA-binding protein EIF1AD